MTKTYIFPDGKKAVFEYDHNGIGKITLECMDMLMGQLIAYKRCVQNRSFWDSKHCDDCMFYDDCPFNPREDEDEPSNSEKPNNCEDEPQTERYCTNCKHNGVIEDYECRECYGMDKHEFIEPQTDCAWK